MTTTLNNRPLTTLPNTASTAEVISVLKRDGGVIVEDMLSEETLGRFMADLQPYLDRTPYGADGFTGSLTRRCSALFAKSMATADLITQRHLLAAAEDILGEEYSFNHTDEVITSRTTIQVNATQVIQIWPGQGAQQLHRDDGLHHRHHPGPDSLVQVLYAGTDFTEENGATRVVPGSHLWDDQRRPLLEETVPAVMKRGSGLIYVGSVYHGGGANRTKDMPRSALHVSLTRGYLRQEENQYLVVPKEIVRRYDTRVQQLLGYQMCPPFAVGSRCRSPRSYSRTGTSPWPPQRTTSANRLQSDRPEAAALRPPCADTRCGHGVGMSVRPPAVSGGLSTASDLRQTFSSIRIGSAI